MVVIKRALKSAKRATCQSIFFDTASRGDALYQIGGREIIEILCEQVLPRTHDRIQESNRLHPEAICKPRDKRRQKFISKGFRSIGPRLGIGPLHAPRQEENVAHAAFRPNGVMLRPRTRSMVESVIRSSPDSIAIWQASCRSTLSRPIYPLDMS